MENLFRDGYCAPTPIATEDPIVMYLIVRKELNMTIGKTGAQIGHAVQLVMQRRDALESTRKHSMGFFPTTDPVLAL